MSTNYREQNVNVGASATLLARYEVQGAGILTLSLTNKGLNPLSAFELRAVGAGENQPAVTIKTGGFTVPDLHALFATGEPANLAAGSTVMLYLNVALVKAVEFWASSGSGTTVAIAAEGREG
ncbi:hypothetical protein ACR2R6_12940 [Methylocaldum gracile subsp. desertum]|jgi:hypothetical protein|uniref:hypothetical protein n=1 Tax=Methylocaldum sp. GT1BW TaxID=3438964 RepID=UPI003DA11D24